jgi:putative Mn2+ efflux pump MntP
MRNQRTGGNGMNFTEKSVTLMLPEIGMIALTRGALGVGIGLLLSNSLEKEERQSAGLALLAVGVLTTIPLLLRLRNALK